MGSRWKSPYRAALSEENPDRVPELCEAARRAIQDRLIELENGKYMASREREALDESLRQLFVREQHSALKQ